MTAQTSERELLALADLFFQAARERIDIIDDNLTHAEKRKIGKILRLAALRAAGDAPAWQPIETAPADVQLLLGWWHEWPTLEWQMTADQYSNTRGGWRHSWATHWMPLPAPFPRPQRGEESSAPDLRERGGAA